MAKHYSAFISYSHADAGFARWLHARLETYRFPRNLTSSRDGNAARHDRLGPIFRDREELPAATSLTREVQAALEKSDALIVLCSPAAAQSQWVNREIEEYRALHPENPILPALIEGEPEDAFPPALLGISTEAQPLAADFRRDRDGRRLALLKLVAGMSGVPLAELMQRDAQRRLRRVTAVTAASFVLLLAMGAMTYLAIQSRNAAEEQRAQAIGLVQYMLTDLRGELRGVGRLDIMQGVNRRVLDYYSAQGNLQSVPDDSLEWWARTLHAIGEDGERSCDWESAGEWFTQAHRTTEQLLEREPDNPDRIFAHAQSEFWVGYTAWQLRDLARTRRYWRGYLEQARALARLEPDTPRTAMELGYAHGNMCEVLGRTPETRDEAVEYCRAAIEHVQQAIARDPDNPDYILALANRRGWMADILLETGQLDEALEQRRREQELVYRQLRSDPQNFDIRLRATWPIIGMGEIESLRGNKRRALELLGDADRELRDLTLQAPGDEMISEIRIRTLLSMARTDVEPDGSPGRHYLSQARRLFEAANKDADCGAVKRFEDAMAMDPGTA